MWLPAKSTHEVRESAAEKEEEVIEERHEEEIFEKTEEGASGNGDETVNKTVDEDTEDWRCRQTVQRQEDGRGSH